MIDRSLLDETALEFVVVSDTHYMRAPGEGPLELESRRLQTARVEHALRMVASLDPAFVIHLGDLVQAFPEMDEFDLALAEALGQIAACGLTDIRHVAGNHDVGDKPDPTMPTAWVTSESLDRYHASFGPSWYSWNAGGFHFVVLNSQIMNGALPEADEQRRWCEADLAANAGAPVIIALHLAPFLVDPAEPSLGHYDNIAEPARSWLIDFIERYDVRLLFTGHSHFQFFNRIGGARFFLAPSTSFTRPGFSEIFSSPAPPDRGRDDTAKLGFFLVRAHEGGPRVHRVRTLGAEGGPGDDGWRYVVTRLPVDLPRSPLGVVARHQIAPNGEVPVAWPSMIRQPVRNDYPLLACLELGVRHLRVPASDLADPVQRERLAMLREEGVNITAVQLWSPDLDLSMAAGEHVELLDALEVQLPGTLLPDPEFLRELGRAVPTPITVAPLLPNEVVPGKQHARARIGYRVDELAGLDAHLSVHDIELDRVVLRVDHVDRPWDVMARAEPPSRVGGFDWLIELATLDEREQSARVAEALFAAALQPGCRLFFDPLTDFDRTMDLTNGLIDRLSNPRPAYNVARLLNSLLFGRVEGFRPWTAPPAWDGARSLGLQTDAVRYCLMLPECDQGPPIDITGRPVSRVYDLQGGRSRDARAAGTEAVAVVSRAGGPALLVFNED